MLKETMQHQSSALARIAVAAPRRFWLAGLGAAAVTRQWARDEAGHFFRSLVREGAAVEARAVRALGHNVEASVSRASRVVRDTRDTLAPIVSTVARNATQVMPRFRFAVAAEAKPAPRARGGKARKTVAAKSSVAPARRKVASGKRSTRKTVARKGK